MISFWGLNEAIGQWSYNGNHIVSEDAVSLFVAAKSPDEFVVKGKTPDGRPASCSFDYRIVAKDGAKRNARMEVVNIPERIDVPRKD